MADRLESLERLVDALGPAVGQVARLDDAVDDLEKWIADERMARRQHNSDVLRLISEIRADFTRHRDDTTQALGALRAEIQHLGVEQQNGRRAVIIAGMASAGTIVAALAGAVALILTSGGG